MKYIIRWNAGYGDSYDIIEAASDEDANSHVYEVWHDDIESNADYSYCEATPENIEEHGLEELDEQFIKE